MRSTKGWKFLLGTLNDGTNILYAVKNNKRSFQSRTLFIRRNKKGGYELDLDAYKRLEPSVLNEGFNYYLKTYRDFIDVWQSQTQPNLRLLSNFF